LEPAQIRQLLKEKQFEAGAVAIAILILFVAGRIVVDRLDIAAGIDQEIDLLAKKKIPLEAIKKVVQERKDFLKTVVQGVPEKRFIAFLTDLAERRGITISEFEPVTSQTLEHYVVTNISFSCSVSSLLRRFYSFMI